MKRRFSLYHDIIRPILEIIVGKRYSCCGDLRNCTRCCKANGWDDWMREKK